MQTWCSWVKHGANPKNRSRTWCKPKKNLKNKLCELGAYSVCRSRLGGPDCFAQGCKSIVFAMIVTTMQTMCQPVWSLCPPPNIALECICQTAHGFSASWPIIAPVSEQDSPFPRLMPSGSWKMQAQSRYLPSNHYAQWFIDGQKSLPHTSLIAEKFT